MRIREIVASTLEMQVKDPRLGMVTITDARVTPDLRDATLYYTVYGDAQPGRGLRPGAGQRPRRAAREVGRQTGIKFTPTLAFVADVVPGQPGSSTSCWSASGTPTPGWPRSGRARTYAGDADPYRKPEVPRTTRTRTTRTPTVSHRRRGADGRTDDFADGGPSAAQRSAS